MLIDLGYSHTFISDKVRPVLLDVQLLSKPIRV